MSISYHVPLELYYYCDMENSNNDDKWLCQLMWAIGFVLFVSKHPTPILAVWTISATFAPC